MAACRTVTMDEHEFNKLVSSLKDGSTLAYFKQTDGSILLYVDDGTGTHLDTIKIKKGSGDGTNI